jgi:hypothetical protein
LVTLLPALSLSAQSFRLHSLEFSHKYGKNQNQQYEKRQVSNPVPPNLLQVRFSSLASLGTGPSGPLRLSQNPCIMQGSFVFLAVQTSPSNERSRRTAPKTGMT